MLTSLLCFSIKSARISAFITMGAYIVWEESIIVYSLSEVCRCYIWIAGCELHFYSLCCANLQNITFTVTFSAFSFISYLLLHILPLFSPNIMNELSSTVHTLSYFWQIERMSHSNIWIDKEWSFHNFQICHIFYPVFILTCPPMYLYLLILSYFSLYLIFCVSAFTQQSFFEILMNIYVLLNWWLLRYFDIINL